MPKQKRWLADLGVVAIFFLGSSAITVMAAEGGGPEGSTAVEDRSLEERVRALEKRAQQSDGAEKDGADRVLHPVVSLSGAKLSGGLTGIYQRSAGNASQFGGNGAEGQMSADLYLDVPIGDKGSFLLRLDIEQGDGLTNFPPVFTNPDGNLTGPNNDVESFDNHQSLNVNEARYEHLLLNDTLKITLGQIDLTSYFDENAYANKETFQYIAQHFNNNIAIDWGGTENFFGPGFVLTASPTDRVTVTLGWFEGDGNYENFFNDPFLAAEVTLKTDWDGREGAYRLYGWERKTPHCTNATDPSEFLDCQLITTTTDRVLLKDQNSGIGLSLDQQVSSGVGVWARAGYQDPDVSQFDKAFSAGIVTSASQLGRPHDTLGLAYGLVIPAGPYKAATGHTDHEHYAEVYYKFVVSGDGVASGFHVSPDLQYVVNPAGDGAVDPVIVYGVRTQVSF